MWLKLTMYIETEYLFLRTLKYIFYISYKCRKHLCGRHYLLFMLSLQFWPFIPHAVVGTTSPIFSLHLCRWVFLRLFLGYQIKIRFRSVESNDLQESTNFLFEDCWLPNCILDQRVSQLELPTDTSNLCQCLFTIKASWLVSE